MKKTKLFFVTALLLSALVSFASWRITTDRQMIRSMVQELGDVKAKCATLEGTIADLQQRTDELEKTLPIPMIGIASWYGNWEERAGNRTANGEIFRKEAYTVAHRTLPFGTVLLIQNIENGKLVPAVVNDRGPYIDGRSIDLTEGLAKRLGFIRKGLVEVRYYTIYVPQDPLPYNKASAQ